MVSSLLLFLVWKISAHEALLTKDNAQSQETVLKTVEQLVKSRPPDLQEVCLEVVKVLLHLSDSFGLPEFSSLRQNALVALAVECPQQVSVCVCVHVCINRCHSSILFLCIRWPTTCANSFTHRTTTYVKGWTCWR